ncbi:MAG: hypothetical protein JSW06_05675 [Thermoplasmatales archaeon]|nr:MAG: hypothetical protein JSW06_05675 [Thermoplasmatales archaeon]
MLNQEDKDKIIEMRKQGYSLQAIHDKTGFAIETIRKVLREYEEKKSKKFEEDQIQTRVVPFDSTIEGVRELSVTIDNLIKTGQLKEADRREWERRLEELRFLMKVEADGRIPAERADAVVKRDEEWREVIAQDYVEKGVAINLENTINSKDVTIDQLRNEIAQKVATIINKQDEIIQLKNSHQLEVEDLKGQNADLSWQMKGLNGENWKMYNIIQDYQNYYNQRDQEYQKRERELSNEKTTFNREVKEQEIIAEKSFFEADKRYKEIEMQEKQLDEQAVKLKKREDEFNKKKKQLFDALNERIKSVENREKNVIILEKRLLRQNDELDKERKKLKRYYDL